jgi:hypothetical protein
MTGRAKAKLSIGLCQRKDFPQENREAKRVDGEVVGFAIKYFGRHVSKGTDDTGRLKCSVGTHIGEIELLGQAKVVQLDVSADIKGAVLRFLKKSNNEIR